MDLLLTEYKPEEKKLLLKFRNKLEEFSKEIDPQKRVINSKGFSELSLEEILNNVNKYQGKILFVKDGASVVGFIIGVIWEQSELNKLEIGPHTLGEILHIYLDEGYRRKGIGKMMIQKMESYFKEKGCDGVWIEVSAFNGSAHDMYKKLGFNDREIGMLKEI